MLTTRFGNKVTPERMFYGINGNPVGGTCRREHDGALVYYRLSDLRHPDGIHGVISALESAPESELDECS